MSLDSIAAAILAQIATNVAPAPPPRFHFGEEWLQAQQSPPRIVVIPRTERIWAPTGVAAHGDGVTSPRALCTRHVTVEVHMWGETGAAAEDLLTLFVQAVHDIAWGAYQMTGGDWHTGSGSLAKKGAVYVLNMIWMVPITRRPDTYATVNGMPIIPAVAVIPTP